MKVDYINREMTRDCARVTFVGYDSKGRRRPMIELDVHDLVRLVEIAKEYRKHQQAIARLHAARAESITSTGIPTQC